MDRHKVSWDNFEYVPINWEDKPRISRGIDQAEKVSFAFLECFGKVRAWPYTVWIRLGAHASWVCFIAEIAAWIKLAGTKNAHGSMYIKIMRMAG